jgi:hypothetical protein
LGARTIKVQLQQLITVQAPAKYEFVLNLESAKTLSLDVSPNLVALADDVIE